MCAVRFRRRAAATLTAVVLGSVGSAGAAAGSAESPDRDQRPDVARDDVFAVEFPPEGRILDDPRPVFRGTSFADASITLAVDGDEYARTRATEDGTWSVTPERDLPVGVRFTATVSQRLFIDSEQDLLVRDLAVRYPRVTIDTPADGSTVDDDIVVSGSSLSDAMIGVRLEGAALDGPLVAGIGPAAPSGDDVEWPGRFDVDEAGDWTFTPKASLQPGEYTLTAEASQVGVAPELSASTTTTSFVVPGGAELPDTGSPPGWPLALGAGLLVLGGAAALTKRGRHV